MTGVQTCALPILEAALGQIEKQFGKGSVMKLGEYKTMNVEAIPTGDRKSVV